jgi:AcrR family transcriptional regulator
MEAAAEHFSHYGYDATRLEAIAKVCDISKPAIYYHFKDKAALYEAVLLKRFSALAEIIEKNTDNADPAKFPRHIDNAISRGSRLRLMIRQCG